ncbi:MAG: cob(I)yrinic acid a,c-diamide adenosyltransferase [Bacteroidetes bacterium]|nr:cob(I)yrinic acid a,c-diamide adenosyltransferase [Bacteroidota bacterium]
MNKLGFVHIYTGDGKGKTTAAVGLACRALGHGLRVLYVHYHKNPEKYGYTEIASLRKLGADILAFAKDHPFCEAGINLDELKTQISNSFNEINSILKNKNYDLLIMDEVLICVRDSFLDEKILLDFVKNKPPSLELVLTGRGATQNLMDLSDYVNFIKKIKHPYDQGAKGRIGIEF